MYDADMTARRSTWGCALLLGLAACQPSAADEQLAVTQRVQAAEERLAAMETELEAMQTKLDGNASELETLRAESVTRRKLGSEAMRPPARIDGAEGIECEGFETASIECKIDRAFMISLLDSPDLLITQARAVPAVQDGKTRGYKLFGIRPGSLPKLLGMMNGDMITSMGGKPLDSIDAAMEVYEGLRKGGPLVVDIERKGEAIVLTLEIVE